MLSPHKAGSLTARLSGLNETGASKERSGAGDRCWESGAIDRCWALVSQKDDGSGGEHKHALEGEHD